MTVEEILLGIIALATVVHTLVALYSIRRDEQALMDSLTRPNYTWETKTEEWTKRPKK